MLSHRILTALILIPLVVAAVLWLATWQLAFLLAPLLVMAGYEWAGLGGLVSPLHRSLYAASLLLLLALGLWLPAGWRRCVR